jgi:hypothetical protein
LPHEKPSSVAASIRRRLFIDRADNFDWRSIMERVKQVAGLSWMAAVVAVLAAMLASMASFGFVVAVYAASSGELQTAMAKMRGAPAPASAVVAAPRKPKSG